MQFTPGQFREIVGISVETFRHWKRVLPSFNKRKRYVSAFGVGDLLAGKILRQLTEGCGIRVGHLAVLSDKLLHLCNTTAWASLERATLLIDLVKATCRLSDANDDSLPGGLVLYCNLRPFIEELRAALLQSHSIPAQPQLHFPPVAVESPRRAGGGAS